MKDDGLILDWTLPLDVDWWIDHDALAQHGIKRVRIMLYKGDDDEPIKCYLKEKVIR